MEQSRRAQRVSCHQQELLWEFLDSNRDIAAAYNRSTQAKQYAAQKWREIAETLNSQGEGAHKNHTGWCKYWVDYKAKLKRHVATVRASYIQTGGGPSNVKPLTEIEEKFLLILGQDFGQGMPGVRVELPPEIRSADIVQDSPASESILLTYPQPIHQSPIPSNDILFVSNDIIIDPPIDPIQEPLAQTPSVTPSQSPHPASISGAQPRRRRRRDPPMTQAAARRALVRSTQMYAEAAVRSADALEDIRDTVGRIEWILKCAFPTVEARPY